MKFTELKKVLSAPHDEFKSIPFWSWNNDLDENELLKQIEHMKSLNMGGFIMHARTGLKIEYLGEKWFSLIKACLKKAKELNMEAWIYDENGWPSGFVGGHLLENESFRAQFLQYKEGDFDSSAFSNYVKKGTKYLRVNEKVKGVKKYYSVYVKTSPSNTDILNPEVVDAFIKETHEQYYARFKDSFGKELKGFFTDEPQYYAQNTPYTKMLLSSFTLDELKDNLIYLFVNNKNGYAFRYKYYSTLNDLYVNNYYKKIYDWCSEHNCMLTGHSVEESGLGHQMVVTAGVTRTYKYQHIPGLDWLGKYLPNQLMLKQIDGVSAQFDKKQILAETFACCGYDVKFTELKHVGEFLYFGGVNKTCQHLYPYSLSDQGKYDFPPVFSRHNGVSEEMAKFNTYFERLGFIIGNTKQVNDLAIIHPEKNMYLDYIRDKGLLSVKKAEDSFYALLKNLDNHGVNYHVIDEEILAENGKINGETLVVGNCSYSTVIVPQGKTIATSTYKILERFNGRICALSRKYLLDGKNDKVSVKSNVKLRAILENPIVKYKVLSGTSVLTHRTGELGDFLFIKNISLTEDSTVYLQNAEEYKILDLDSLSLKAMPKNYTLKGKEGLILVADNSIVPKETVVLKENITDKFSIINISKNSFVIDKASYSLDGKEFSPIMPKQAIFDKLLFDNYSGKLYIKEFFTVNDLVDISLTVEDKKYLNFVLNGISLKLTNSDFDINFRTCDITKIIKLGLNEINYSMDFFEHDGVHFALFDPLATESLRNCLYFDTSIENTMFFGEFTVNDKNEICAKKLPTSLSNLEKQGYSFFNGEFIIKGNYDYDGNGKRRLNVAGDFVTGEVTVNKKTKSLIFSDAIDVTDLLKKGENEISIKVKISLKNLFGPFHFTENFIYPGAFTFRGEWVKGTPNHYCEQFIFSPIGVNEINMESLE